MRTRSVRPRRTLRLAPALLLASLGASACTDVTGPGSSAGPAREGSLTGVRPAPVATYQDSLGYMKAGRPGAAGPGLVGLQAASAMILEAPGGFSVEVVDAECAAQGNTVTVTSPVSATVTTDGCRDVGARVQFDGPFPAGTQVSLAFHSGYTGRPGAIQVSGQYPQWRVAFEDGFDNDFNDVVVSVRAGGGLPTGRDVRR